MRERSAEKMPSGESEEPKQEIVKVIPFSKKERELSRNVELLNINKNIDNLQKEIEIMRGALAGKLELKEREEIVSVLKENEQELKRLISERRVAEGHALPAEERAELEALRKELVETKPEVTPESLDELGAEALKIAEASLPDILDKRQSCWIFMAMGVAEALRGDNEAADSDFEKAKKTIKTIADISDRNNLLVILSEKAAVVGRVDEARKAISRNRFFDFLAGDHIKKAQNDSKLAAEFTLAYAELQAGHFKRSAKIAEGANIPETYIPKGDLYPFLIDLSQAQAEAGKFDDAEKTINGIEDREARAKAVAAVEQVKKGKKDLKEKMFKRMVERIKQGFPDIEKRDMTSFLREGKGDKLLSPFLKEKNAYTRAILSADTAIAVYLLKKEITKD